MRRVGFSLFVTVVCFAFLSAPRARSAAPSEPPGFREVYDLIRSNFPALSETELNQAAIEGLVQQLKNRVIIAGSNLTAADASQDIPLITKASVIENSYGYIRIGRAEAGLGKAFDAAFAGLGTNKLQGIVLDLRFTTGRDYAAVVEVANRFVAEEEVLFKVGDESFRTSERADAWALPLMVLVNRETSGGAEVLAAVLRKASAAVIIGSTTAGQARHFRDFVLSNGQTLKIGTGVIALGDGTESGVDDVRPDVSVTADPAAEKLFLDDPYAQSAPKLLASRLGSRHVFNGPRNEADLVRMQREGIRFDPNTALQSALEQKAIPTIQDPGLARAVDLLKGIQAARQRR